MKRKSLATAVRELVSAYKVRGYGVVEEMEAVRVALKQQTKSAKRAQLFKECHATI